MKMLLAISFIVTIQFARISNENTGCGCDLNRSQGEGKKYSSILNLIQDIHWCPLSGISHSISSDENLKKTKFHGTDVMVLIPEGVYQFGTDDIAIVSDNEGPKKLVKLESFFMDKYEVSNREYLRFTESATYKTHAEFYESSFVFGLFLNATYKEQMKDYRVVQAPWWYNIKSSFKFPFGMEDFPETKSIEELLEHPVVHVSWVDALAYCEFYGKTLPTEAQWEAACRGGHRDTLYPWGNKLFPNRKHMANIWQGTFPYHNSAKDGYVGTCPVNAFPPNDFGLYNMVGNVWEWTLDSWTRDKPNEKVKKGGSYLCHRSYCFRYRCSARSHNTKDSSAGNLGFRCVKAVS